MITEPLETKQTRAPLLDGFLTRAELAAELGCHERTVARLEHAPDGLPSITVAGRKRYRVVDVHAFLERRVTRPNPVRRAG